MTLYQLNQLASQLLIPVIHSKIHTNAISMADDKKCMIVIKDNVEGGEKKEKALLAEELGHCVNQAWYNNYSSQEFNSESVKLAEGKAQNYKIKHLVNIDELIEAFNQGVTTFSDLCEYFDMPNKDMYEILKYYDDNPKLIEYKKEKCKGWDE